MLNCKQVSQLVTESLDKTPGFWARMNLWMHLGMCGLCWQFRKTVLRVHREAHEMGQQTGTDQSVKPTTMPVETRTRIQEIIRKGD